MTFYANCLLRKIIFKKIPTVVFFFFFFFFFVFFFFLLFLGVFFLQNSVLSAKVLESAA